MSNQDSPDPPRTFERVETRDFTSSDKTTASGCMVQLVARTVATIVVFAVGGLAVTIFDIDIGRRSVTIVGCGVVLGLLLLSSIISRFWRRDDPRDPDPPKGG